MPKIRIEVYDSGLPAATVTIPGWLAATGASILPKFAGERLQDRLDLKAIAELIKDPKNTGPILEIDDHKTKEKVVISIVRC